jgi:hypothetical protein
MCDKCSEIDGKIAHYRAVIERVLDQPFVERVEALIADLLALKDQLHPQQQERPKQE